MIFYASDSKMYVSAEQTENEEKVLPEFTVGESGPHTPSLMEKWTQPPKSYTEATLLRAMETAGKLVDNDELRDALKENGIGRPSTRAAIIETLFKRNYIRKESKNLIATPTGVELIGLIHEELLKSAELTGIWEKKLREIEKNKYDARQFLNELKQMVTEIVTAVRSDYSNRHVTLTTDEDLKKKKAVRNKETVDNPKPQPKRVREQKEETANADEWIGLPCPVCKVGKIIKGHTAYGCSRWKEGCTFRRPFDTVSQ